MTIGTQEGKQAKAPPSPNSDFYELAQTLNAEKPAVLKQVQFGRPIASFQLIQGLLARMLANVTASQCMVVRTAQLHAEGKLGDHHAALAKAFCTCRMRETVAWAREILGGNGISTDYNVARFFTDAEVIYNYEGTYQMQNLIVGKAITGFSAFV